MKNILGKKEDLELFNADGTRVYKFEIHSTSYWNERTYDDNGNQLTYKDSDGATREFDVKEYTMEELTEKLGHNFKIKK